MRTGLFGFAFRSYITPRNTT